MKILRVNDLPFTDFYKLRVIVEVDPTAEPINLIADPKLAKLSFNTYAYHYLQYETAPEKFIAAVYKNQDLTDKPTASYVVNESFWKHKHKTSKEYIFTLTYSRNEITKIIVSKLKFLTGKELIADMDQYNFFTHLKALSCYYTVVEAR